MKNSEITALTDAELRDIIAKERLNLQNFYMTHTISTLENPGVLKATRKKIARLLTEVNRRKG